MPGDWERLAQRKGFSRYMSPALRALVTKRAGLLQDRELALSGILKVPAAECADWKAVSNL